MDSDELAECIDALERAMAQRDRSDDVIRDLVSVLTPYLDAHPASPENKREEVVSALEAARRHLATITYR